MWIIMYKTILNNISSLNLQNPLPSQFVPLLGTSVAFICTFMHPCCCDEPFPNNTLAWNIVTVHAAYVGTKDT